MAGRYNIDIKQGDSFFKEIKWNDIYGELIDLTKYVVNMQIREGFQGGLLLLDLVEESGIDITDNIISIIITDAQSLLLNVGRHYYSIILTRRDGFIVRILEGYVNIT